MMLVELGPETAALLARYAAVRGHPCDGAFADSVLGASLLELLPRAERIAAARKAADAHSQSADHG